MADQPPKRPEVKYRCFEETKLVALVQRVRNSYETSDSDWEGNMVLRELVEFLEEKEP